MVKRRNAFKLMKTEQDTFIKAVTSMIADGSYANLVQIHADLSHNMYSLGTLSGQLRFLSWNRALLLRMEAELTKRAKDAFLPYWHWVEGGVPDWLLGFKPTVNGTTNQRTALKAPIATRARIDELLKIPDYNSFTLELESNPHNLGHRELGAPMNTVPTAPCDPMFWLHHAEVDRVWAEWQRRNPGLDPILAGVDAIMDPWPDTVASLRSIANLGYSYH